MLCVETVLMYFTHPMNDYESSSESHRPCVYLLMLSILDPSTSNPSTRAPSGLSMCPWPLMVSARELLALLLKILVPQRLSIISEDQKTRVKIS